MCSSSSACVLRTTRVNIQRVLYNILTLPEPVRQIILTCVYPMTYGYLI